MAIQAIVGVAGAAGGAAGRVAAGAGRAAARGGKAAAAGGALDNEKVVKALEEQTRATERIDKAINEGNDLIGKVINALKPILDVMSILLAVTVQFIFKKLQKVFDFFEDPVSALQGAFDGLLTALTPLSGIKFAVDLLNDITGGKLDGVAEAIVKVQDILSSLPQNLWEKVKDGFVWVRDSIFGLPQKIWDKVKDLSGRLGDEIKALLPTFLGGDLGASKRRTSREDRKVAEGQLGSEGLPLLVSPGFAQKLEEAALEAGGAVFKGDAIGGETVTKDAGFIDTVKDAIGSIIQSGNDFIVTKNGSIIKANENDNIVATKRDIRVGTPDVSQEDSVESRLITGSTGGSGTTIINNEFVFNGLSLGDLMEVIKRELSLDSLRASRL